MELLDAQEASTERCPAAGDRLKVILGLAGGSRVYEIDECVGKWNHGWLVMANRRRRYFVTFDRPGLEGRATWIGWSLI